MVAKRVVDAYFWQDGFVLDNYSVEDKYFLLYLLTNPLSSQIGIYSLPKKVISFETDMTIEVVAVLLDRFANKYGSILYSETTQEIALLDSLKYSIVKGGKPVSNLLKREIRDVQESMLIYSTYQHLLEFWTSSNRPFDTTIRLIFEAELIKRNMLDMGKLPLESELDETEALPSDSPKDVLKDASPNPFKQSVITSPISEI